MDRALKYWHFPVTYSELQNFDGNLYYHDSVDLFFSDVLFY